MNCTKIFFWLIVLLTITYNLCSQNAPITAISSAVACPGDTIILHITATNCPIVSAIGLELDYDAAVLSLVNANPFGNVIANTYNTNSALYAYAGNFWTCQTNFVSGYKKVRPSWGGFSNGGVVPSSINNVAQLCDIAFRYYGGTTSIIFNNSFYVSSIYGGQYCSYADNYGNDYIDTPTVSYYINGTVTQVTMPAQPSIINGYTQPIVSDTTVYSVPNVAGVNYSWSAPSAWFGTSNSSSVTYIVGTGTGIITITPSNCMGTGPPRTFVVAPMVGNTIKGNLTYDNSFCTPLDSAWMFLKQNGSTLDSVQTDINGHFQFNVANNGSYNITATTHKAWGGVNTSDAVKVLRHFVGSELLSSSIRLHSADVNLSYGINAMDAVNIKRRFVGSDTSFEKGNWVFEKPSGGDTINVSHYMNDTVVINGNNVIQDFKGLCVGDVNGSYFPSVGQQSHFASPLPNHSMQTLKPKLVKALAKPTHKKNLTKLQQKLK